MKNSWITFILIIFFISPTVPQTVVSIDSLRYNDSNGIPIGMGSVFTTSGIVTSSNQFGNSGPGSIQDQTAGVSVYGVAFANQINIGDSVTITGELTHFRGLTQMILILAELQ